MWSESVFFLPGLGAPLPGEAGGWLWRLRSLARPATPGLPSPSAHDAFQVLPAFAFCCHAIFCRSKGSVLCPFLAEFRRLAVS